MLGLIIFMVVLAGILANWEIQIEGADGWAKNLPCWRKAGAYERFFGKEFTGYHFWMVLFLFAIIHLPFLFVGWNARMESLILGFLAGMLLVEDFLWFVFNPAYGLKNFRMGKIGWHRRWIMKLPDFYWPVAAVVILLYAYGGSVI